MALHERGRDIDIFVAAACKEPVDFEIVGENGGRLPVLGVQRMRNKGHV